MIGVKYENLRDPAFLTALQKMASFSKPEPTFVKKLFKLYKCVTEEIKVMNKLYQAGLEECAERDEHGNMKPMEGVQGGIKINPAMSMQWDEIAKKIAATEATLECEGISFQEAIAKLGLTPQELVAVEPLLIQ